MHTLLLSIFAATYGSNPYDTSTYGGATTQSISGSSGGGSSAGGGLTNTGIAIATFATVACLILLVAIVIRVWRRPNKATQVTTDAE